MKALFISENYLRFYDKVYQKNPDLLSTSYAEAQQYLFGQHFYQSDSHADALRRLGHDAETIIHQCIGLQAQWAMENNCLLPPFKWDYPKPIESYIEWRYQMRGFEYWFARILLRQVRKMKPDIIQIFSGIPVNRYVLKELKKHCGLVICQWACPLKANYPYDAYDLILTTVPDLQKEFTQKNIPCELIQHGFDERSTQPQKDPRDVDLVFAGSLSNHHQQRITILEEIARHHPLQFFGEGLQHLSPDSPLRQAWKGHRLMGTEMLQLLARSKIALHIPVDMGASYFGAKRPFEVTGSGALLLTLDQPGIPKYFNPGSEIEVFDSAQKALDKIQQLLNAPEQRQTIAQAGQRRTLTDHTQTARMREWLDLIAPYLRETTSFHS